MEPFAPMLIQGEPLPRQNKAGSTVKARQNRQNFAGNVAEIDFLRFKTGPKVIENNSSPGLPSIERASGVDVAHLTTELI